MINNIECLKQFTKEELLYGIGYACSDCEVRMMEHAVEVWRMQRDSEKERRLLVESNNAMNAYFDYMQKLCEKYGDGKTVNLAKVPLPEIEQGAKLEADWKSKEKQWQKSVGLK